MASSPATGGGCAAAAAAAQACGNAQQPKPRCCLREDPSRSGILSQKQRRRSMAWSGPAGLGCSLSSVRVRTVRREQMARTHVTRSVSVGLPGSSSSDSRGDVAEYGDEEEEKEGGGAAPAPSLRRNLVRAAVVDGAGVEDRSWYLTPQSEQYNGWIVPSTPGHEPVSGGMLALRVAGLALGIGGAVVVGAALHRRALTSFPELQRHGFGISGVVAARESSASAPATSSSSSSNSMAEAVISIDENLAVESDAASQEQQVQESSKDSTEDAASTTAAGKAAGSGEEADTEETDAGAAAAASKRRRRRQQQQRSGGVEKGAVVVAPYVDPRHAQLLKLLKALQVVEDDVDPQAMCERGDFARWLLKFSHRVGGMMQVHPAMFIHGISEVAFDDVEPTHKDYAAIQGLAEAGVIPSRLSLAEATAGAGGAEDGAGGGRVEEKDELASFHADLPLVRRDLLKWKFALEHPSLPRANAKALQQGWSLADAHRLDDDTASALVFDLQRAANGESSTAADRSLVLSVFGFLRRFDAAKPVTNAQAAAALSFGHDAAITVAKKAQSEMEAIRAALESARAEAESSQTRLSEVETELGQAKEREARLRATAEEEAKRRKEGEAAAAAAAKQKEEAAAAMVAAMAAKEAEGVAGAVVGVSEGSAVAVGDGAAAATVQVKEQGEGSGTRAAAAAAAADESPAKGVNDTQTAASTEASATNLRDREDSDGAPQLDTDAAAEAAEAGKTAAEAAITVVPPQAVPRDWLSKALAVQMAPDQLAARLRTARLAVARSASTAARVAVAAAVDARAALERTPVTRRAMQQTVRWGEIARVRAEATGVPKRAVAVWLRVRVWEKEHVAPVIEKVVCTAVGARDRVVGTFEAAKAGVERVKKGGFGEGVQVVVRAVGTTLREALDKAVLTVASLVQNSSKGNRGAS